MSTSGLEPLCYLYCYSYYLILAMGRCNVQLSYYENLENPQKSSIIVISK